MVGTVVRMSGTPDIYTSPYPMVDSKVCTTTDNVYKFCIRPEVGLETIEKYPYQRLGRLDFWDWQEYMNRTNPRYFLKNIELEVETKIIKKRLKENFLSGPKFPCVGEIYLGKLADSNEAKKCAEKNIPFLHANDTDRRKETNHSVVIVGIDVSHKKAQKHFVEIKNSWGESYGLGGYTKIDEEGNDEHSPSIRHHV
ncbi:transducin/WD40 repeat-like superfamily protein, partial [Tanacetum coccineum]